MLVPEGKVKNLNVDTVLINIPSTVHAIKGVQKLPSTE